MLGPVRFEHIETCAREVCRAFKLKDELEETISTLQSLDDILAQLRADLALAAASTLDEATSGPSVESKAHKQDYSPIMDAGDIKKARRLITARESSIKSVKAMLVKKRDERPRA